MSGILPRDDNHVPAAGFESSTTAGLVLPGQINEITGRILTSMSGGGGGGSVQTVSVATANGFAGTSDGDTVDPILTLTTSITGILKGNGTAISAAVANTDYQVPITLTTTGTSGAATFNGTTLNIPQYTGGGGGSPGGSDRQVQFNDAGSFGGSAAVVMPSGTDVKLQVTGSAGGGFGYIISGIQNTNSGGRAELSLDTDDGAFAGFVAMAGSATTNSARQMDIGTRVAGDVSFWTTDTERLTLDAAGTSLYPTFTNTLALGSTTNMWADLFLADGGVINWNNGNATITHSASLLTSNVDIVVPDEAYGVGWNGSLEVPTKNAVYDKIQTIPVGDVVGPASATDNAVALFDTTTGKLIQNSDLTYDSTTGTIARSTSIIQINGNIIITPGGSSYTRLDGNNVYVNTNLYVGNSSTSATILSNGNFDLVLKTGNATTGEITLTDGANGNLNFAPNGTGRLQVGGVNVPTVSSTDTLTNKRITKRTGTTTSSATPTINTDNVDEYYITAQTVDITSFTTNLSGTATLGQTLFISVIGTAARAITWGASFANGPVALPTTTVTTTQLSTFFKWDGSVWRCYATGSTV